MIVASSASYFNSDKVALAISHAKPADEQQYARLYNLVEGLCIASGLPKPRLYIIDDDAPERVLDRAATRSTRRSRSPPACSRR